jgi:hypothetical protein
MWTLRNKSTSASKEVLGSWVSVTLEKSLTEKNIKSGFRTIGIFPFNPLAIDGKMDPGFSQRCNYGLGISRESSEHK